MVPPESIDDEKLVSTNDEDTISSSSASLTEKRSRRYSSVERKGSINAALNTMELVAADPDKDPRPVLLVNGAYNRQTNPLGQEIPLYREDIIELCEMMQKHLDNQMIDINSNENASLSSDLKQDSVPLTPNSGHGNAPHEFKATDFNKLLKEVHKLNQNPNAELIQFNKDFEKKITKLRTSRIDEIHAVSHKKSIRAAMASDGLAAGSATVSGIVGAVKSIPIIGMAANVLWSGAAVASAFVNRKRLKDHGSDPETKIALQKDAANFTGGALGIIGAAVFVVNPIAAAVIGIASGIAWLAGELRSNGWKAVGEKLKTPTGATAVLGASFGVVAAGLALGAVLGAATLGIGAAVLAVAAGVSWAISAALNYFKHKKAEKAAKLEELKDLKEDKIFTEGLDTKDHSEKVRLGHDFSARLEAVELKFKPSAPEISAKDSEYTPSASSGQNIAPAATPNARLSGPLLERTSSIGGLDQSPEPSLGPTKSAKFR